ncbi:hypothetical protein B0H13DRAFT_1853055 [Mycena leptocephala]|nr:hypothetical protein B0H13DRAFT_1853055 [Mycena leptocephala]
MYPTNLLGGPVYPPKPIPSEGIQDETLSLSSPIISPLCSVIETRKNWRRTAAISADGRESPAATARIMLRTGIILQVRDLLFPSPYSVLDTSSNLYGSPVTDHRRVAEPGPPHLFIFIDIVPEGSSAQPYESSPQPWLESENVIHVSRFPRRLSCISPTITFTAPAPILAQSRFAVSTNDGTVHTESVLLTASRHPNLGGLLYSAGLVPSYWKTIVESPAIPKNVRRGETLQSYPVLMGGILRPLFGDEMFEDKYCGLRDIPIPDPPLHEY